MSGAELPGQLTLGVDVIEVPGQLGLGVEVPGQLGLDLEVWRGTPWPPGNGDPGSSRATEPA